MVEKTLYCSKEKATGRQNVDQTEEKSFTVSLGNKLQKESMRRVPVSKTELGFYIITQRYVMF